MPIASPFGTAFPQYGVYNEHWLNHPAGLPVSQYKPNTNPNNGYFPATGTTGTLPTLPGTTTTPGTTATPGTGTGTTPPVTTPPATTPPATTGGLNGGMTPSTGFASRYTPSMQQNAYSNPWTILPDVFSGISESSPLYQALRDMGGDPLTMYNIMNGSKSAVGGNSADFVNWLADTYQNMGTAGGKVWNPVDLINTIFSQKKFGADAGNSLGQILGAGDMSTQIRTLFNMMKDTTNMSMNPLAASGMQAALAQAGDRYQNEMMKTEAGNTTTAKNPAQWMAENLPWLQGGAISQ